MIVLRSLPPWDGSATQRSGQARSLHEFDNQSRGVFAKAYGWFTWFASLAQSPFLLFVRLYWGWQFMQTGWGKLHHLAQVDAIFYKLGDSRAGADCIVCRLAWSFSADCC